jgi:Zn-dependent alcohol dehydrogenase
MQQLTMTAERRVEWWDVAAPALCDLDQPILRGDAPIPGPIALGHEFVAEVIDVGDDVATVATATASSSRSRSGVAESVI